MLPSREWTPVELLPLRRWARVGLSLWIGARYSPRPPRRGHTCLVNLVEAAKSLEGRSPLLSQPHYSTHSQTSNGEGRVRSESRQCNSSIPLFRVRLLCRMGIRKSRDGHAGVIDAHDAWIWIEHTVECLGGRHLRDEADIRDARAVGMAEPAAFGMLGEQRFDRLQTRTEPMLDPGKSLFLADLQHVREVVPNTRYYQRVGVCHIDQCQPTHPGPGQGVGRQ